MPSDSAEPLRDVRAVVLVVDDDVGLREACRLILEDEFEVLDVPDGPHALEVLRSTQVDVVLLDIRLPGMDGLEVLEQAKVIDEQVEVILVTAVKTVKTAVTAMKLGAFDYLTKPFEEEEVLAVVRRALERRALQREVVFLRSELARRQDGDEIVGQSAEMRKLAQMIAQVSRTSATVLIAGESGTGKELIAQAIHRQSPRRDKPFVPVNPAAIVESLIESELFGHERGAFTGAYQRKLGKFEMAQGGTLFLDEIASLRAEPQAKLLRVLQEREIERVGGTRRIPVDVRIIAATNVDLKRAVAAGAFREDLYYRLNVVPIAGAAAPRAGARTSRCSSSTSSAATTSASASASRASRPPPWPPSRTTGGRATCASCRTSSSGRWRWSTAPRSSSRTSRWTWSWGSGGCGTARRPRCRSPRPSTTSSVRSSSGSSSASAGASRTRR